MKYLYKDIITMLSAYSEIRREVMQLEFELQYLPQEFSVNEVIEAMTFCGSQSERVQKGKISDKTSEIAVSYSECVVNMNLRLRGELEDDLARAKLAIERMEYYINLLDKQVSDIIRALYIDGLTFAATCEKLCVSLGTAQKLRKKGVEMLVEMYNRVASQD